MHNAYNLFTLTFIDYFSNSLAMQVEWKPKVPLLPKDMSQPVKPPTGDSVQGNSYFFLHNTMNYLVASIIIYALTQ